MLDTEPAIGSLGELKRIRKALEPVEDWYDVGGVEGLRRGLGEVVKDVVADFVSDRNSCLALANVGRRIRDQGRASSDGDKSTVDSALIEELEKLL